MAILGTLGAILGLAVALPLDSMNTHRKIDQKVAQMEANRAFWHINPQLETEICGIVQTDWFGERKLFPAILVPFLEENSEALFYYREALEYQLVIKAGFQPSGVPSKVFTSGIWHAFASYNRNCGADERVWLRIHHPEIAEKLDFEDKEAERKKEEDAKRENRLGSWLLYGSWGFVAVAVILMAIFVPEMAGGLLTLIGIAFVGLLIKMLFTLL